MRTILSLLLMCTWFLDSIGQIDSLKTISLEAKIIAVNQDKVKGELKDFLEINKVVPESFSEYQGHFSAHFFLSQSSYYTFVDKIDTWGTFVTRKIESENYSKKLQAIELEIAELEESQAEYYTLKQQTDKESSNFVKYWEKIEEMKPALRELKRIQAKYEDRNKRFEVNIKVNEENFLASEYDYMQPDFTFVNMPGIQYAYYIPANTESGIYPEDMHGFSIKYLMNRRKTYIELGLFQAGNKNASLRFDELYKFGVGQDFYSAHLGRGTRKFLNLYSGFNLGLFILTGNEENLISWYTTPSIGLELYKNKYILVDTKAGYFLPFKENRNMRGLLFEASFNVVF